MHSLSLSILEASDLLLLATQSDSNAWCEFEIILNESYRERIGGQNKILFFSEFLKALRNESGRRVSTIFGAKFKVAIGDDADYLGNVSLSGYKTFYFFRGMNGSMQIVLSDGAGMMKHFRFDHQACNALVGQCESILASSCSEKLD